MPLTPLDTREYGSPLPVHCLPPRSLLLAATLLLCCAKGATRPDAPTDVLHYPAWIAAIGTHHLLVANLDQDLAYDNGALVALDTTATPPADPFLGGVAVPNMVGQLLVIDAASAGPCASALADTPAYKLPFALVAGRFENTLFAIPLAVSDGSLVSLGPKHPIALNPFSASAPFGVAFTCSSDGKPRAWVSFQSGLNSTGYVAQVDLSKQPGEPDRVVQVNVGSGAPRSFAYDKEQDRLYFTNRERLEAAPVRWIQIGSGCLPFENGIQDERKGGCHVDAGFDLSLQFRGAEPSEIQLARADAAGTPFLCTTPGFEGRPCPRAYLSVRMYDADLAAFIGGRPSGDVGGKLMVLELPEGGLGRPDPQVVAAVDIGVTAGDVHLIPRTGTATLARAPLVAVTAIDDALLWIYDDETGAMVKVFGRDARGVALLGRQPTAIASVDQDASLTRLFVTSYHEHWVSAVDVPLDDRPGGAYVVRGAEGQTPQNTPTYDTLDIRRWGAPQ